MEFIEGRELKDYFDDNERFKLPEIGRIMGELLAALGHAHQNGITHRDIKPANIILLKNGTVKVADFGIARIESSNLTQAGAVLGTPAYMSPEQFMGQTVDGRSDLFSAGVILYQFLTGDKPFTGTLTTIMHKVLKEEPPAPSELNVQVPRQFDALMIQALAKRPEERFQTAQEFAAAIVAAMQNKSAAGHGGDPHGRRRCHADRWRGRNPAAPESRQRPRALPPPGSVGSTSRTSAPRRTAPPSPPRKCPCYAIAGVAAAAIVGGAVFMMKGGSTGATPEGSAGPGRRLASADFCCRRHGHAEHHGRGLCRPQRSALCEGSGLDAG